MATEDTDRSRWLSYSQRQWIWNVIEGPYVVHLIIAIGIAIIIGPIIWIAIASLQTNESARIAGNYFPAEPTVVGKRVTNRQSAKERLEIIS